MRILIPFLVACLYLVGPPIAKAAVYFDVDDIDGVIGIADISKVKPGQTVSIKFGFDPIDGTGGEIGTWAFDMQRSDREEVADLRNFAGTSTNVSPQFSFFDAWTPAPGGGFQLVNSGPNSLKVFWQVTNKLVARTELGTVFFTAGQNIGRGRHDDLADVTFASFVQTFFVSNGAGGYQSMTNKAVTILLGPKIAAHHGYKLDVTYPVDLQQAPVPAGIFSLSAGVALLAFAVKRRKAGQAPVGAVQRMRRISFGLPLFAARVVQEQA